MPSICRSHAAGSNGRWTSAPHGLPYDAVALHPTAGGYALARAFLQIATRTLGDGAIRVVRCRSAAEAA